MSDVLCGDWAIPVASRRPLLSKPLLRLSSVWKKQDRVIREDLVYDRKNDLVIMMLTDITDEVRRQQEFASLKEASLERAQQVIEKQMRVAQEIAGLLGETTAETKAILTQLMQLFQTGERGGNRP